MTVKRTYVRRAYVDTVMDLEWHDKFRLTLTASALKHRRMEEPRQRHFDIRKMQHAQAGRYYL